MTYNVFSGTLNPTQSIYYYTVSQKKQGTTILSITSTNVDRFSNFFHWQIH